MKKIIVLFLMAILTGNPCLAETVNRAKAAAIAQSFFSQKTVTTKAGTQENESCRLVWTFPEVATKAELSSPLLYAFEGNSGGFVIISGEDAVRPVLGYSLHDAFPSSDMPDNMRSLLSWYSDIIAFARSAGWEASQDTQEEWQNFSVRAFTKASESKELETAQWSQGSPYNDLCPLLGGERCVTGCVATALAIIMRYHQWPLHGYGHLDSYYYSGHHLEGHDLDHKYDWDNMPLQRPDNGYNEAQSHEIAQLVYDACVLCKMVFGPKESATSFGPYLKEFCAHFGYDQRIKYLWRQPFEDDVWENMVKNEIDASRPVYYTGNSTSSGHAFVIDGYIDQYFRINYGWAGTSNGYYLLSPIDGHRKDLLEYYKDQDMVCQIQPDRNYVSNDIFIDDFCNLSWDFTTGSDFSLNAGTVYNYRLDGKMDLCYVLYDNQWKIKEVISEVNHIDCLLGSSTHAVFPCKIVKNIADGDRIVLSCYDPYTNNYNPLISNRQSQIVFLKRPLKDLVEIGYSLKEDKPVFYMKTYKDIYWQIVSQSDPSWSCTNVDQGVTYNEEGLYSANVQVGESQDAVIRWFQLPKGSYLLKLKNFNEETTFEITI